MSVNRHYEEGLALARQGHFAEGLGLIHQFLAERPCHGQALNDAGVLHHQLGQHKEAVTCLERAMEVSGVCEEVYKNLMLAYLGANRPGACLRYIEPMLAEGFLDDEMVVSIAQVFYNLGQPDGAVDVICRVLKYQPDNQVLVGYLEQFKRERLKIAFFIGGDGDTFLKPILEYARQRYNVRVFEGANSDQMYELMQWSDISWFEWATNLAAIGTTLPKVCKTIVRLHRYEAYNSWPKQINWDQVDTMITVGNTYVMDAMRIWVPDIDRRTRIVTIPNGVELDKIAFRDRPRGKNIAFIAAMRMVKNPMFLLQCVKELHDFDPEYHVYIAGKSRDIAIKQYLEHMARELGISNVMHFDDWQADIPGWLADKHFVAVTSVFESQGMGALEAMAAGLKPIIHNFPGADQTFGNKWLFNTPEEFSRLILDDDYDSIEYRRFVERKFAIEPQLRRVEALFAELQLSGHLESPAVPGVLQTV